MSGLVSGRSRHAIKKVNRTDAINAAILRAVFGDLTKYGLRQRPYGPLTQVQRDGHIPLIDVGTIRLIKDRQVTVHGGINQFNKDCVSFLDGKEAPFDAVILATGYRPCVDAFLKGTSATLDENGTPLSSGRATPMPGLYFCGFHVAPTGMLREIGIEAQRISAAISSNARNYGGSTI